MPVRIPDAHGLVIRTFPGLRFDPVRVPDLAAVTAPPYDVVDAPGVLRLEHLEPHNLVRLTLPRPEGCGPGGRYVRAAALLASWREDGTLTQDEPSLYVYQQVVDGASQRGVIAAVTLSDRSAGLVLPHEDVMVAPVQDRTELMAATQAQLEPILLLHSGDDASGSEIEAGLDGACAEDPVVDIAADGEQHRLWRLSRDAQTAPLIHAFTHRRALIADGHHRWAAYRAVRSRAHGAGLGSGPWDEGLALLVDGERYPPRLASIHRVMAGLSLTPALAATKRLPSVREVTSISLPRLVSLVVETPIPGNDAVLGLVGTEDQLGSASRVGSVSRGGTGERGSLAAHLLRLAPGMAGSDVGGTHRFASSPSARSVAFLHDVLAARIWGVTEDRITYHHDLDEALGSARAGRGVAALMPRARLPDVMAIAAAGDRMPRKSTSFGPKPRSGLVLRPAGPGD